MDDESSTHDVSVYRLSAGTFPTGTWVHDTLPAPISTGAEEDQPFFTGQELIMSRRAAIVSHPYLPTAGAETVLLGGNGNIGAGEVFSAGEPTVATIGGKRYLYFVYVEVRDPQQFAGVTDFNLDAGFVEIP